MALTGRLIQFDRETLAVEYECTLGSQPKAVRQTWPLGSFQLRGFAMSLSDAIGRDAVIDQGRVSVYCGNGNSLIGNLVNGGSTESIRTVTLDIPCPKCRTETRWHDGRWEKLLRKGWVPV